ncbi:FGGY-family carbohydrate kinase [Devosia sp.]|uniref:FGGY-family carbohydrate kinase n=1 Tax=Devosia sp. TaxID=1871048 RepID=UPI0025C63788|nr:FGGY-family carbohydrate kinase [Devosia sp.]
MSQTLPRHIAVIDIGKTNAKVVLIDRERGAQIAALSRPNDVLRDGLYPHADVDGLWDFILASLGTLQADHRIDGISITTHGATAALVTDTGLALPVLDYEFDGPEASRQDYTEARPPFAETLSPPLPNGLNLGAQIFWQAATYPDEFAAVKRILTYPQYWAWRLTGVAASEVTSLGCHTDLWNPGSGDFSTLVSRQGWRHLFPELRPAASILGPILPEIAARTGLATETPVTCGIHDSNASLVPHLARKDTPFSVVSAGTWTICMTVGGSTDGLDEARDSLANVDAFGRPVPTARFMGGREWGLLVTRIVAPSAADTSDIIARNVHVLPGTVPGAGPFSGAKGGWNVDPQSLSDGQRNAAVSLYLALMTRECLGLCGLGNMIVVEGPLARNTLFCAALGRLSDVPVYASGDSTGTSMGASLLFGGSGGATTQHAVPPMDIEGLEDYAAMWRSRVRDNSLT